MTATTSAPPVRSTDLRTKADIAREFFNHGSPRIVTAAAAVAVVVRVFVGGWSWGDIVAIGVVVAMTGVLEWIIHVFVLHCPEDSFRSRRLGAGVSHRQHHLDPPRLRNLLLDWNDAALFVPLLAALAALWSVPLFWFTGLPVFTSFLTALAATWIGLAHYELTHLMVHTAYRPKLPYYRRLARNHRLHHYRNERYWLGVTSNVGDRILRTHPKTKTDVPLSDTARTLG